MPVQPSTGFGQMDLRVPRATRVLLLLYVGLTIVNALAEGWLRVGRPLRWTEMLPGEVLGGQVWRLVTHPWIEGPSVFALLFGALALFFFASPLERSWGSRRLVLRLLVMTGVPAALTSLLALALPALAGARFFGASAFAVPLIVAFASLMGAQRIYMFPIPIPLSGDTILYIEGGFLALSILFAGSVLPFVPTVVSFLFALAWFRLDMGRGLRKRWRRFRLQRDEERLATLRRRRGLRVVGRDDENDDEPRYLN